MVEGEDVEGSRGVVVTLWGRPRDVAVARGVEVVPEMVTCGIENS